MLNLSYIATFIKVAELGSFNKAADELYLSPNSVMNQINVLEDELGNVKLMRRNKRGIELTSVGKVFYTEAKEIMSRCDEAKKKVRVAAYNSNTVKLVTYHGMPLDIFGNIWSKAKEKYPELNVEMVLYDGSKNAHLRYLSGIGEQVDLLLGTIDARYFDENIHSGLELTKMPLFAVMNINHRLAGKEVLTVDDFSNETLLFPYDRWSEAVDIYQSHIISEHPDIRVKRYDPDETSDIYSFCAGSNDILINPHSFTTMHPFLKAIPIAETPLSSFGIIYAKNPSKRVQKFIDTLEESRNQLNI